MSVPKVYTLAMLLAGALAGLAATMNVLGRGDSLSPTLAGTIGFDAITVALLGRATPLGTVLAGLLFGAMAVGGVAMQASAGTPQGAHRRAAGPDRALRGRTGAGALRLRSRRAVAGRPSWRRDGAREHDLDNRAPTGTSTCATGPTYAARSGWWSCSRSSRCWPSSP